MTVLLKLRQIANPKTYRNGFEAFKIYSAVKRHITTSYNGVKYDFKLRVSPKHTPESFPEKYIFDKIARNYKPSEWGLLFARNAIHTEWVRDFAGDEGQARFNQSSGFLENSFKRFESEFNSYLISCHNRKTKFSESLRGETPLIFVELEQGRVSLEFLVLIDAVAPFLKTCDSFLYKDYAKKISKYAELFCIDKKLLSDAIKSQCS